MRHTSAAGLSRRTQAPCNVRHSQTASSLAIGTHRLRPLHWRHGVSLPINHKCDVWEAAQGAASARNSVVAALPVIGHPWDPLHITPTRLSPAHLQLVMELLPQRIHKASWHFMQPGASADIQHTSQVPTAEASFCCAKTLGKKRR